MKIHLVASRARPFGTDLDHCTVSRVNADLIRLIEHTQIGRIALACAIAAFGLQCLPSMLDKPTRGKFDELVFFSPLISTIILALLVAFRKKSLFLNRQARMLTAETCMGPFRLHKSMEPLADVEGVLLHSDYIQDTEDTPYWLYKVSVEGQTQIHLCTRSYDLALKTGSMLSDFLAIKLADYCEQESRKLLR